MSAASQSNVVTVDCSKARQCRAGNIHTDQSFSNIKKESEKRAINKKRKARHKILLKDLYNNNRTYVTDDESNFPVSQLLSAADHLNTGESTSQ
jgi:hypothetical protein